jgi:hypothetical protein
MIFFFLFTKEFRPRSCRICKIFSLRVCRVRFCSASSAAARFQDLTQGFFVDLMEHWSRTPGVIAYLQEKVPIVLAAGFLELSFGRSGASASPGALLDHVFAEFGLAADSSRISFS